jgi:mono/diheme cytochrome c family protein
LNANLRKATPRLRRRTLTVAAVCALPMLTACEWFTDFKRQPSLATWAPIHCDAAREVCDTTIPSRGNPQYSVPVYGTARSAFETSYTPLPGVVDSFSNIPNPTPISEASLRNGHKYYQINCAVCHGDQGAGNGPATKYGVPGITLTAGPALDRTDGYIYGIIRNGRGAMPSYNRIEEMDRWDVVNYIRALQGKSSISVATGPLAVPGVTGRWVPGYTQSAPTRPAPFVAPAQGSAKAYYPPGGGPPATDSNAVTVGPKLLDSMLYKSGIVEGKQR